MKKKTVGVSVLAVVAIGVASCIYVAWQPAIAPAEPVSRDAIDATLISQGANVAGVGDCMYCHTAQGGKSFAGGRPVNTPFGTIYSTNITPDAQTGIGRWSLQAFTRALRQGVARDGHLLYPAFPYQHFTRMNGKDIESVYAYLMSRDPVAAPPKQNDLRFPFNFRPLVAGWNLLFLRQGELRPDPSQSTDWNLGRYLVEGPAHCAACHTPMNALGGQKDDQPFAGGSIDGWDVPALNKASPAPVPWTREQLTSYLRTGIASEHGAAAGPMLPVTRALATVPEKDVQAMATYILSMQQSGAAAGPAAPAGGADQNRIRNGEVLFSTSCASCHGASAPMSDIGKRASLDKSSAVNAAGPRNTIRLILDGIPAEGSEASHFMPAFGHMLADGQIADIVAYVRAHYSKRPAWSGLEDQVAKIRKETPQQ